MSYFKHEKFLVLQLRDEISKFMYCSNAQRPCNVIYFDIVISFLIKLIHFYKEKFFKLPYAKTCKRQNYAFWSYVKTTFIFCNLKKRVIGLVCYTCIIYSNLSTFIVLQLCTTNFKAQQTKMIVQRNIIMFVCFQKKKKKAEGNKKKLS